MSIWFTSDTHFCHTPIIKYASRPFANIGEMNATLIKNWNSVVKEQDTVYVLGDFGEHTDPKQLLDVFNQLNGKKCLILGNNDKFAVFKLPWSLIKPYLEIFYEGRMLVLSHYPMKYLGWNKSYKNSIHLHGHLHSTIPYQEHKPLRIDVGVDGWSFHPVNIDTILKIAGVPPCDSHVPHHIPKKMFKSFHKNYVSSPSFRSKNVQLSSPIFVYKSSDSQ